MTIGLDLAKNIVQPHGVDAKGEVVVRKQLRRSGCRPYLRDRVAG
jgi:transposase